MLLASSRTHRRIPAVKMVGLLAAAFALSASQASAQASFTPSYNAPYRAFASHEFGGTLSFPDGAADFALEGQYRFGQGRYDIGLRGGVIDYDGDRSSDVILGAEARFRVIDHTQQNFPLDGAVVIGVGTADFDVWAIPAAGLSLGRRVDLDGFSFIAYGQPTLFLTTGYGDTDIDFGLGLGADFRVGQSLDLRSSFGLADGPGGVAFSLVWIR